MEHQATRPSLARYPPPAGFGKEVCKVIGRDVSKGCKDVIKKYARSKGTAKDVSRDIGKGVSRYVGKKQRSQQGCQQGDLHGCLQG